MAAAAGGGGGTAAASSTTGRTVAALSDLTAFDMMDKRERERERNKVRG